MKKKYYSDYYTDKMIRILSKVNIDYSLVEFLMMNYYNIKSFKLKNNKIIDLSEISGTINYLNKNITTYDNLIRKHTSQKISTAILEVQLEESLENRHELLIEMIDNIEKYIEMNIKEIIIYYENNNDMHYIIDNHKIHNIHGAAVFDDNNTEKLFYINGEKIDVNVWKKNPLVRKTRIRNIMK